MIRFLNRLLRGSEIQTCLYAARCASHRAIACARLSTEPGDAWDVAARKWRATCKAALWEARGLAG